jgi:hypothetical protein
MNSANPLITDRAKKPRSKKPKSPEARKRKREARKWRKAIAVTGSQRELVLLGSQSTEKGGRGQEENVHDGMNNGNRGILVVRGGRVWVLE